MGQVKHVNGQTFNREVLQSQVPVLVDFYADWCGPCKMMGPILAKVAAAVGENARIVKVNVDDEPELATKYRVSSIPALVVIRDGKVAGSRAGLTPAEQLVKLLGVG